MATLKSPLPVHHGNPAVASLLIRIGLAGVFTYAAISAFRTPTAWISYIPAFTTKLVSAKLSLDIISVFQLLLAIALLTGKYLKYTALIAALLLGGIMVTNLNTLLITFRDFGLVLAALALLYL